VRTSAATNRSLSGVPVKLASQKILKRSASLPVPLVQRIAL
jgi:hypothetical protein